MRASTNNLNVSSFRSLIAPRELKGDCRPGSWSTAATPTRAHEGQQVVWSSVIEQRARGDSALIGAMLESNLEEGRQDLTGDRSALRRGVSITDACIGWDETE